MLQLRGYTANTNMTLTNNGHTIQATYTNGNYTNDEYGTTYQISQFHFHTHSEESVDGLGDIASMHLVHAQVPTPLPYNALSVLGVLFVIGPDNPIFDPIIAALSKIPVLGDVTYINFTGFQSFFDSMNAAGTNDYWNYPGSLTTPPCTEKVDWTVLSTPWSISQAQLDALNAILVQDTNSSIANTSNYRHVQRTLTNVSYYPGPDSNSTDTSSTTASSASASSASASSASASSATSSSSVTSASSSSATSSSGSTNSTSSSGSTNSTSTNSTSSSSSKTTSTTSSSSGSASSNAVVLLASSFLIIGTLFF